MMALKMDAFNSGYKKLPLKTMNGDNLVANSSAIDELLAEVNELCLSCCSMKLPASVLQHTLLADSLNSATIEGARTTVEDVVKAMSKPRCDAGVSERMVLNAMEAISFLCDNDFTLDNFIHAWEVIVEGVCENANAGSDGFRTGMVFISSNTKIVHVPEKPENIVGRMEELFTWMMDSPIDAILKSIVFHFYCVYIHPFCDGNGRIARASSSAYLAKNGYGFFSHVPVSKAINDTLAGYYSAILESENVRSRDITPFVRYMLGVYGTALVQYSLLQSPLSEKEILLLSKMARKGTISIGKSATILKCTEQEALQVLNSMLDKGYLSFVHGEYRIGWRN